MFNNIFNAANFTYLFKFFFLFRLIVISFAYFGILLKSIYTASKLDKKTIIPLLFLSVHITINLFAYLYIDNKQKEINKYNGIKVAIGFILVSYVFNIFMSFLSLDDIVYDFKI